MILAQIMLLLTISMIIQAETKKKNRLHLRETPSQQQSRETRKKGQLKRCP